MKICDKTRPAASGNISGRPKIMLRNSAQLLLTYAVMIIVFSAMSVLSYSIPEEATEKNIYHSLEILNDEGKYPLVCNNLMWAKDNCTDGTMFNIAISSYDKGPVESAIMNLRSGLHSTDTLPSEFGLLALKLKDGSIPRRDYKRYWHGYLLPLKVASVFVSLHGIRIINMVLLWSLLCYTTFLLYRFSRTSSICWIASFVIMGFPVVPLSVQYVACYYIMFIGVILSIKRPSLFRNGIMFFIIGGCTSFFDFFTVPIITLCMPLAVISILSQGKESFARLFKFCFSWAIGYSSVWITKWCIASLFTSGTASTSALLQGKGHSILSIAQLTDHKYFYITIAFIGLTLVAIAIAYFVGQARSGKNKTLLHQMLFIAILPVIWNVCVMGHSVVHIWFTYRDMTVCLFCGLVMLFSKGAQTTRPQLTTE